MGINSTPAPDGATTFTNNDAAILAAWDRRAAAFAILQALPDNPRGDGETPERHAQWAIIDAAEAEIRSSVATTARGAEIQLWCAVVYQFDDARSEEHTSELQSLMRTTYAVFCLKKKKK